MERESSTYTEENTSVEDLFIKLKDYTNTRIDLIKLKGIQKTSGKLSSLIAGLAIGIILLFIVLLLSTGVALWLGELLGEVYYGFFIVSGFYIIIGLFLWIFRKKILKTPLSNWLIRTLFN